MYNKIYYHYVFTPVNSLGNQVFTYVVLCSIHRVRDNVNNT